VKVKISGAILALTNYMHGILAGDIDKLLNEWADPFSAKKNQMIILPGRVITEGDATAIIHTVIIASIIAPSAKKIAETQIVIMEKIYNAFLFGEEIGSPVLSVKNITGEFFEPTPGTPNVGLIQIDADLVTDYLLD
jgi:hypothetical protein